jgi:hypothetical protein
MSSSHNIGATAGAAEALRDQQKGLQYRRQGSTGYEVLSLTLETLGRLSKPLLDLL